MEQLGLYCIPGVVFLGILLGAVPFSVFKEIIGYRNSGPHPLTSPDKLFTHQIKAVLPNL